MGFRLEDKIRYHISDYVKLKNEIKKINGRLLFPKRKISSLYFDNKNLDMFNDSEEGNVPRKKINSIRELKLNQVLKLVGQIML